VRVSTELTDHIWSIQELLTFRVSSIPSVAPDYLVSDQQLEFFSSGISMLTMLLT